MVADLEMSTLSGMRGIVFLFLLLSLCFDRCTQRNKRTLFKAKSRFTKKKDTIILSTKKMDKVYKRKLKRQSTLHQTKTLFTSNNYSKQRLQKNNHTHLKMAAGRKIHSDLFW